MFEKEAIRHAFEDTIGVKCLIKPVEDFTYEELSDEQQEKAYDFKKGAEFGYNKAKEEMQAQIEKMKCCGNCKYSAQETAYSIVCKVGGVNKGEIENVEDCLVCDKWEIKKNDI